MGSGGSSGGINDSGDEPPLSDGENPDGSEPQGDTYDPNDNPVPTEDDRDRSGFPDGGSAGCEHGFAPAESPAFTQRFNVHKYIANVYTIGTVKRTKKAGYRNIRIRTHLRISQAIPLGKELELEILIAPSTGMAAPSLCYSQSIHFDSTTPTGEWIERERVFRGFANEETPILVLLIRRNDLTSVQPTSVELWRDLTEITYE